MRALVTGGAGFIGSHIVDALLERNHEVLIIDDLSTGNEKNLDLARASEKPLTFAKCDICSAEARAAVAAHKPEVVFHLAAQMDVRRSVKEPVFDAEKNVIGTANMLESSREAGCKRFIFSSTGGAIYGEQSVFPAAEDHPIHPECPYGVSKAAGELYLEYYGRNCKMMTTALRYGNVYGPRQNAQGEAGVVAIFIGRLISGRVLTVFGDGGQTRDYVYVGDVVSANMAIIKQEFECGFHMYNIGRGIEVSVLDLIGVLKAVWRECGSADRREDEVRVVHAPERLGEQRRSVVDASRISAELGWNPVFKLEDGFVETVKSFVCE